MLERGEVSRALLIRNYHAVQNKPNYPSYMMHLENKLVLIPIVRWENKKEHAPKVNLE